MPAKSDKVWADAIGKAIHEYREETDADGIVRKVRWINVIAGQLVRIAAEGDIQAVKEIGDRLDGKPQVSVAVTANKDITDLNDDELTARIAAALAGINGSGEGTNGKANGKGEPSSLH